MPGLGRSSRGGNSLHYPCLESPVVRGAGQATKGHKESDTTEQLSTYKLEIQ